MTISHPAVGGLGRNKSGQELWQPGTAGSIHQKLTRKKAKPMGSTSVFKYLFALLPRVQDHFHAILFLVLENTIRMGNLRKPAPVTMAAFPYNAPIDKKFEVYFKASSTVVSASDPFI
jgi:hypothetical protein